MFLFAAKAIPTEADSNQQSRRVGVGKTFNLPEETRVSVDGRGVNGLNYVLGKLGMCLLRLFQSWTCSDSGVHTEQRQVAKQ